MLYFLLFIKIKILNFFSSNQIFFLLIPKYNIAYLYEKRIKFLSVKRRSNNDLKNNYALN
ncbi:MAG: hypothetical protein AC479_07150 [miscellaneous Crenarchaeota group-6 archaeon AD8-1]|nr:MAG: hypothetical protein AC479_07150 [miscellaneous Crenarchaeota group-6 archaeon AD8-1]